MPAQSVIEKLLDESAKRPKPSSLALALGTSPIHRDDIAWHIGAIGEQLVGRELAGLPEGWRVFHSLPIGKGDSDVDHVVVGPGGIFALNTKHHAGKKIWIGGRTLMVSGQRKDYIRSSEFEADRLTKLIQVRYPAAPAVIPVLVFVGTESIVEKTTPERVVIQTSRRLGRWMRKLPAILPSEGVAAIAAMMDDPANWRSVDTVDQADLSQRFTTLTKAHEKARLLRVLWRAVGGIAVLVIVAVIFEAFLGHL